MPAAICGVGGGAALLMREVCAGVRVESVTGPIPGQPGQVRVAGGQVISAAQAVVVATEGPAARALLGDALSALDSKTEEAVGTANLYFRCAASLAMLYPTDTCMQTPACCYCQHYPCSYPVQLGGYPKKHVVEESPHMHLS